MDSKKKFNRNRYWKRKYRPRNATTTVSIQNLLEQKKNEYVEEESEDEFILNQPIPKEGWFLECGSSSYSDIENFDTLITTPSIVSTSSSKNIDIKKECDAHWFDKELDNIQLNSEVTAEGEQKNKLILTSQENVENQACNTNLEVNVIKKIKDSKLTDSEEAELEFLLSLKEPVYTGPIIVKKKIENERRIASSNLIQQKPIKSIDLEKWLDSVLDD